MSRCFCRFFLRFDRKRSKGKSVGWTILYRRWVGGRNSSLGEQSGMRWEKKKRRIGLKYNARRRGFFSPTMRVCKVLFLLSEVCDRAKDYNVQRFSLIFSRSNTAATHQLPLEVVGLDRYIDPEAAAGGNGIDRVDFGAGALSDQRWRYEIRLDDDTLPRVVDGHPTRTHRPSGKIRLAIRRAFGYVCRFIWPPRDFARGVQDAGYLPY